MISIYLKYANRLVNYLRLSFQSTCLFAQYFERKISSRSRPLRRFPSRPSPRRRECTSSVDLDKLPFPAKSFPTYGKARNRKMHFPARVCAVLLFYRQKTSHGFGREFEEICQRRYVRFSFKDEARAMLCLDENRFHRMSMIPLYHFSLFS